MLQPYILSDSISASSLEDKSSSAEPTPPLDVEDKSSSAEPGPSKRATKKSSTIPRAVNVPPRPE